MNVPIGRVGHRSRRRTEPRMVSYPSKAYGFKIGDPEVAAVVQRQVGFVGGVLPLFPDGRDLPVDDVARLRTSQPVLGCRLDQQRELTRTPPVGSDVHGLACLGPRAQLGRRSYAGVSSSSDPSQNAAWLRAWSSVLLIATLKTIRSNSARPAVAVASESAQDVEHLDVGGVPRTQEVAEPEHRQRGDHHAPPPVTGPVESFDEQDVALERADDLRGRHREADPPGQGHRHGFGLDHRVRVARRRQLRDPPALPVTQEHLGARAADCGPVHRTRHPGRR